MRKVLIFALTLAIALGALGYAHAAVTESQDDLLFYPKAEHGDPAVLEGIRAAMTFNCGDHLLWHSTYAFGGDTETEFVYDRKGIPEDFWTPDNEFSLWLSGGMSASTTGSFSLNAQGYGALLRFVMSHTDNGGSHTENLRLGDFVEYYAPDFQLYFREQNLQCNASLSFLELLENQHMEGRNGIYNSFLERFRFPVQEDQLVSVTVTKDDMGRLNSLDICPENGPDLRVASHLSGEGIWFVPIFRDEHGNPLPYESPQGHGVYFVPWKVTDTYDIQVWVAPDLTKLRRVIPLEESLVIDQIEILGDTNECRMLSREGAHYILSSWDLTTGEQKSRLEVLPHDPEQTSMGSFAGDNGLLLVTAGGKLALVDPQQSKVLLTAPDVTQQRYFAYLYNAELGDLRFDGQRLYLLNPVYSHHDGVFWIAVWQEGELLYYGEHDCSLMRGNDDWYNASISTDLYPMTLLLP